MRNFNHKKIATLPLFLPAPAKKDSLEELTVPQKLLLMVLVFILGIVLFLIIPIPSVDWNNTFYPVARNPLRPYLIRTFINPPWTSIILFPLQLLPRNAGQAINASLNLVVIGSLVRYKKGNLLSIFLTLTSFPFLSLLANGSIEWIPAMSFFFQNGLGVLLLLTKPQSGLLSGIDWFIHSKHRLLFCAIPMIVVILSFTVWGNWPGLMLSNIGYVKNPPFEMAQWNISLFPWTVPIGLGLVIYITRERSVHNELFGAIATYCLVPYLAPHSLTILFALLSATYPRSSIMVWLLLWLYPVLKNWDRFIQILGFG